MQVQAVRNSVEKRKLIIMIAAFAAVYVFWGSTYLAIRYAIETIPPFLMAAVRFLIAGVILYLIARIQPDFEKPKAVHWRTSFIVGALLLLGGNGGVVFAERYISSSLAALLVAVEPFWVVIFSWLWLRSARPNLKVVTGLALGFAGVWFLISGQLSPESASYTGSMQFWAPLVVIASTFCWAAGSIFGLRAPVPKSSILSAGMQMMAGGSVLLAVSLIIGEWRQFDIASVSRQSLLGVAYLTVFGSLLGFTAYSWLLKNAKPANVATYAYINPLIAVLLGWLIAGESMSGQMLIGAGIVVGSVVLITSQNKSEGADDEVESHQSISPTGSGKTLMVNCE
jgi:Permeases of the drug/metabolite transporter (DMT) superfamily